MANGKVEFSSVDDDTVVYISLPEHEGKGVCGAVDHSRSLRDLISDYKGREVVLDFNQKGELVGIEILL